MCLLSCLGGTESVSAGCFHSSLPLQLKNSTHLSAMLTYTAHSYIHAQCNYITTYSAVHFIYFHTEGRRGRDEREREREKCHTAVLISSASVAALTSDGNELFSVSPHQWGDEILALRESYGQTLIAWGRQGHTVLVQCVRDTGHGDRDQTRKKQKAKEQNK